MFANWYAELNWFNLATFPPVSDRGRWEDGKTGTYAAVRGLRVSVCVYVCGEARMCGRSLMIEDFDPCFCASIMTMCLAKPHHHQMQKTVQHCLVPESGELSMIAQYCIFVCWMSSEISLRLPVRWSYA